MTPPDKINQFLTNVSDLSLGYNEITFFDPRKLQEEQVGFSFDTEGNSLITGNEGDWKKEWLVIAHDEVGDPIMIDSSAPQLTVLSAQHGQGAGEPFIIADSLDNFQNILSILSRIAENRATPVDLEQNPIPDDLAKNALNQISKQNPHTEIWFWEGYFENEDTEEGDEGSKKPWWRFW